MATKNIKGITIEIGGNTTKLQDALKGVDKQVYSLNSDLKSLNQALKLDPKNTELLAQKQDVLKRNIAATTEKLNTLKEAQKQMGSYSKLTDEQKSSYNRLSAEIAKSENALKSMNEEMKKTNSHDFSKLQNGLKKVGNVAVEVSKKLLQVSAAVAGAMAGVVAAGVKSYAELESASKGAERLFGSAFDTVQRNASEAYKTLGLSAKDYYDQVNTYAVGLKNALGGNEKEAANLANKILVAQADIVAATGASQESVQNAFAAVMRGNYTMIDNLRLGIKGSKEGMQEVIDKVNAYNKAQGKSTKYVMGNYADMQKALVDYVEMQGIAGKSSELLSTTLNGSISAMKASWDNFINGSGTAEDLGNMISNVLKNIGNAISKLAPSILSGIVVLLKDLLPQISKMIIDLVPQLLVAISDMIDSLLEYVSNNTEELSNTISKLIQDIVQFITENLPKIVEIALQIMIALAEGIAQNIDTIIPALVQCIITIVETLIKNIPKIIEAGFKLLVGLAKGIVNAREKIKEAINGVIDKIKSWLSGLPEKAKTWGKDMIQGFINGIKAMINKVGDAAKGIADKIKNFLHFSRPDEGPLRDYETWMPDFLKGLAKGMDKSSYLVKDAAGRLAQSMADTLSVDNVLSDMNTAMRSLNSGIENSVNPIINPAANSNPLIIQIENFNNNSESDIQSLAQKLEFYRKNTALARGGK